MNLVVFYPDEDIMAERILNYYKGAIEQSSQQPNPRFHRFIARALIALYLSDAKVFKPSNQKAVQKILHKLDPRARLLQKACLKTRKGIFSLSE